MNISDISGNKLKACATVNYKGYIISMSTIFNASPILVFKEGSEDAYVDTLEQAIAAIDEKVDELSLIEFTKYLTDYIDYEMTDNNQSCEDAMKRAREFCIYAFLGGAR